MAGGHGAACCDRCARSMSDRVAPAVDSAIVGRRRLLKAAVLRSRAEPALAGLAAGAGGAAGAGVTAGAGGASGVGLAEAAWAGRALPALDPAAGSAAGERRSGFPDDAELPRTVFGIVQDVSPHVLVLGDARSEQRYTLTPDAVAWRGTQLEPAALRQGDRAVVRLNRFGRHVADRVWANIGRVTGIITDRSGNTLTVDEGATRQPQVITLRPNLVGRIQVRFPTLEPGYLVDIIGLREEGELIGVVPATSQPSYPADRVPDPPLVSGRVPDSISGSATWHEPHAEPQGILGVDYPALDPETGCAEEVAGRATHSYARMPYLAIGSVLRVRNDCTGADCLMPVTGCASIARLFNDRCVTCGTSPRGRIADLTLASFVALGGELERGCFNATITMGG